MKKLIVFFTGKWTEKLLSIDSLAKVNYFVDNRVSNNEFDVWHGKPVYSPLKLLEERKEDVLIIIADSKYYQEISRKLSKMGFLENIHYYNGWDIPEEYFLNMKKNDWKYFEEEITFGRASWDERAAVMSSMIPEDVRSIIDFGCGNQRLKKYLNEDIQYIGLDYIYRGENTIVCDVNQDTLPSINADCAYMAGFLMYVKRMDSFFSQIATKYILLSYEGHEVCSMFGVYEDRGKPLCYENYKNLWEVIQLVLDNQYRLIKISGRICETFCLFQKCSDGGQKVEGKTLS